MDERVTIHIGPVSAALVKTWVANGEAIVAAVQRANALDLPVSTGGLDLCEVLLHTWAAHAAHSDGVFDWSYDTDTHMLELIADTWLAIGGLTDDQLSELGVSWAPPETRPVADAVVAGVVAALEQVGPAGTSLLHRIVGTSGVELPDG